MVPILGGKPPAEVDAMPDKQGARVSPLPAEKSASLLLTAYATALQILHRV
jgi:hypothetical protein